MRHVRRACLKLLAVAMLGVGCDPAPAPPPAPPPAVAPTLPRALLATEQVAVVPRGKNWEDLAIVELREGERLRVKIPATLSSMELVKIPAGVIDMPVVGADGQLDRTRTQAVRVGPFWMATTETTWEFFNAFRLERDALQTAAQLENISLRPSGRCTQPHTGVGDGGYAAICLGSLNARLFCTWLSFKTGRKYRLPTEAEWEYACRAGGREAKQSLEDVLKVAWVEENAEETSHPVGRKPANAWGLHDMLGNVGEWAYGVDGVWVQKGGSWLDPAANATPAFRAPCNPEWRLTDPQDPKQELWLMAGRHVGFRIVREVD